MFQIITGAAVGTIVIPDVVRACGDQQHAAYGRDKSGHQILVLLRGVRSDWVFHWSHYIILPGQLYTYFPFQIIDLYIL